ncbi:alpha-glucan family phosphorylase, partial [Candidatus Kaiserbacteria bacterium]|nr:alpha-glucan family phosphorylase [Candidatus Kaiserbacteria bacterium]
MDSWWRAINSIPFKGMYIKISYTCYDRRMQHKSLDVAYFSMEFALDDRFHNFAGGLGVLAADTMYSFADLGVPAVGVTLWYHQDDDAKKALDPSPYMKRHDETITVQIENRMVKVIVWEYEVTGASGKSVPILFLSTNHPDNEHWDRDLTKWLYASDRYTRLGQEAILGIGGYRALKACGYVPIKYYHMNEGHTALMGLERLRANGFNYDIVRSKSTFTTHTPIPAGHDYFDYNLAHTTLTSMIPSNIRELATHDSLGMTQLAMNLSVRTNAVSRKHAEVTRDMFPGRDIEYVTNGIYHPRWVGPAIRAVLDKHLPGWTEDPAKLRDVFAIPDEEIEAAMRAQKQTLIDWVNTQPRCFSHAEASADDQFDTDTLTVGFARRFVSYKRPDLIFKNIDRLRAIGHRKVQFVFAGHCHPDDAFCNRLHDAIAHHDCELRGQIRTVVASDYNLDIATRMVQGVDIWLNNPVSPR